MSDSDRYANQMEKAQVDGCTPVSETDNMGSPTTCGGSTLTPSVQHTSGFGKIWVRFYQELDQFHFKCVNLLQIGDNIRGSTQK